MQDLVYYEYDKTYQLYNCKSHKYFNNLELSDDFAKPASTFIDYQKSFWRLVLQKQSIIIMYVVI